MAALGASSRRGVGRQVLGARRARSARGDRGRPVRVLGDPSRAGARARGRRGGAAQARRARPGDDRPRRVRDGAPDDPGDARVRAADRGGRARRAARQLHEPGRDRDAGAARPHRRARGRHLRRSGVDAAKRRRVPRPAPRAGARRLLRAEPLRLDPPGAGGRRRPAARDARPVRGAAGDGRAVGPVRSGARARRSGCSRWSTSTSITTGTWRSRTSAARAGRAGASSRR